MDEKVFYGKVTARRLNVRSAPEVSDNVIYILDQNTVIEVTAQVDLEFVEVKLDNGTLGYVKQEFLEV